MLAIKFLEKISSKRRQVCWTFTGLLFTAGHVSSQRGEVSNKMIKQHVAIKELLQKYTHYETIMHVNALIDRREIEALDVLKKLIMDRKEISPHVKRIWDSEYQKISSYRLEKDDEADPEEEELWAVCHTEFQERKRWVKISKSGLPPSCTCVGFKSSLIPCRHITAVMVRLNLKLFTEDSIADRWKLNRHPLYKLAMEQLGFSTTALVSTTEAPSPSQGFSHQLYKSIAYSPSSNKRFNSLNEMWKKLIQLSEINQHNYRLVFLGMVDALNSCGTGGEGTALEKHSTVLAPETSSGMDVLSNKSLLSGAVAGRSQKRSCTSCSRPGHNKKTCTLNKK